jgi:hypothetical protein
MISPLIAAYLVTAFGGISVEGIRPLYYVQFVGYALVFLLVAARLREPRGDKLGEAKVKSGLIADYREIFRGRPGLRKWILISALTAVPMSMY